MRYRHTDLRLPFPGCKSALVHTGAPPAALSSAGVSSGCAAFTQCEGVTPGAAEPCHFAWRAAGAADPVERFKGVHVTCPPLPAQVATAAASSRPHKSMYQRAGFFVSYNNSSLEPNMTAAVRAMAARHPGVPLYAIGHSMGAAMATIAALDLKFKANLSDVRLVTFGSPRVGNDVFARFLQSQTTVRCPYVAYCSESVKVFPRSASATLMVSRAMALGMLMSATARTSWVVLVRHLQVF